MGLLRSAACPMSVQFWQAWGTKNLNHRSHSQGFSPAKTVEAPGFSPGNKPQHEAGALAPESPAG
jgi:hypothetical protein